MPRTFARGLFAALVALLPAAPAGAAERDFRTKEFTARVDDVRLQARLLEQGHARDDRVTVEVPAVRFDPPLRIEDVREAEPGRGPLVDFLVRYWRANATGNAEAVVAAWCQGERERIRRFVDNEKLFERNRRALEKRPGLKLVGLVRHEDTVSILQDRGGTVVGVTLRRGAGGPCLVNGPADDLELAIIEASFR